MTHILVLGAGKSSSYLIKYLLDNAPKYSWQITVADSSINAALQRVQNSNFGTAITFNIFDEDLRKKVIQNADIVISLLPPALHIIAAKECINFKKNLVTASYISPEIKALHEDARNAGLLFMNEIGLDPGIDHMSAMKIFDEIQKLGGDVKSFKSYCGGLIAPESDTNPWHYKISWNPRNIVMAGKGGAHFIKNHIDENIEYNQLFEKYEVVDVPNLGKLAAYANRDSVSYKGIYGINKVKTILRATFRYEEFCIGWDVIVKLGLTEDTIKINTEDLTFYSWFLEATKHIEGKSPKDKINTVSGINGVLVNELIDYLQLYAIEPIVAINDNMMSNADVLQLKLEKRWALENNDIDMVVMHHDIDYVKKDYKANLTSTLIVKGEDEVYTAMAKTVGLPMAIFTKLFLTGKIKNVLGVQLPIMKEVYKPVLKELEKNDIVFYEVSK
jgi:saccharopine dehydrogenase (NADP+, L-glutamate forming)